MAPFGIQQRLEFCRFQIELVRSERAITAWAGRLRLFAVGMIVGYRVESRFTRSDGGLIAQDKHIVA